MFLSKQSLNLRDFCWAFVVIASIGSALALAILAGPLAPVRRGTSHRFWNIATSVELSPGYYSEWGGDAFVIGGWALYDETHIHGSHMYCVPLTEVVADFDVVVAALETKVQAGNSHAYIRGYVKWRDDPKHKRTAESLVAFVHREVRRSVAQRTLEAGDAPSDSFEWLFRERWRRMDWYWATLAFEWVFVTGLALFAVWPGIRNQSIYHWAVHVALLPLLFFLPTYLGYATLGFTSSWPGGGVVYPELQQLCRRFLSGQSSTRLDEWIVDHLPKILEPLSEPAGALLVLSETGMPGPSALLGYGLLCGGAVLVIHRACRSWRLGPESVCPAPANRAQ